MADFRLVEINNLSKAFDGNVILDNISLDVKKGENLVVFGQSGTGKSVLLKCIIGLITPDQGDVSINGQLTKGLNIDELNTIRKKMGFLFQSAALYDSMSVRENLEFPLSRHTNLSSKQREEKVRETLRMVSLEKSIDKMPSELSGGMRKRIGLARSIITDPELMLYDEPTTGLDPITTKEISELILNLQRKLNMTSIIVTHDIVCAKIIADRAIFLKEGKIAYEGSIEELTNTTDIFLEKFFSTEIIKD
ncbi:MAG: ABC transporter ATP-binding protein [Melioribacteraceae bacterium]|nr:ABC transporter ATP-binding protein [Melioribacteraceae bacterium]MCF8264693.1 ABC transporter ATP-binding protein [Melioribacteraceae bacterium]MCF8412233.1 ABC transporter ATP-binding protein [Melioribacteraceae bacterium]MCF8431115.1 ABC transporter ATP-binding protein [Melioribacteraceae bacterium]